MPIQKQKTRKVPGFGKQMLSSDDLTQEQREHMIAEAAYYLAEHRHFEGGDAVNDWLQAQSEIDSEMATHH
ncbi:MAG: DUF2934 domain-containing protein [Gammaproteobacteria bacterium]|jgi:hypothetical protein|nr:DUF2934 domain-containing protein [Gammaproteobacteria bacterium]